MKRAAWFLALIVILPSIAHAGDDASLLTPPRPGWPLAHPVAERDLPPPPLSLLADRPTNPAYVPGLPGLPQGRIVTDDYGMKRPKYDAVFVRNSRVDGATVVIPSGGLVYLEDTWGGEVALRGEPIPVLGRLATYVDYDMSIVVRHDVTIPAGQSVAVGGQVYYYYATVGHEQMANHALHVRTIAGTDWEWAFGNPVLSETEPGWWGTKFTQLYNQGQARVVTREKMVFDWISGVRMDRILLANDKVFAGWAKPGQEWHVGHRIVRLVDVDERAGTAHVQVIDGGKVALDRVLGPVVRDRLIEDTAARKALVFHDGDIAGFLVPWPEAVRGGEAQLKLYGGAFALAYGIPYAPDARFAVYPVGCPTGHNFGFMLTNREEIRIPSGGAVTGPEGYFKLVVDRISGGAVRAWHVEDARGNRSVTLGGPEVTNVDLVLGQGRVAGQAILADVGRSTLEQTYRALQRASDRPAREAAFPPGAVVTAAVAVVGLVAVAYEVRVRRRGRPPRGPAARPRAAA